MKALLLLLLLPAAAAAGGFRWRGVLEGFYGQPWTWAQRTDMVDWMADRGDNLFVIAPKDEPLQRKRWRDPLPKEYLDQLAELEQRAKKRGVALAWTLSPLGAKLGSADDTAAAASKLQSVLALGPRKVAIAFDDTDPDTRQVDFANIVLQSLIADYPDMEMTFVPAVYWSKAAPSKYFDYVAEHLDSRFLVAWTGPGIIPETIAAEDGRKFREYIRHKLVLGDNYPVQDRLVDSGPLYLGPLLGREAGLEDSSEAFVSNANPLEEAGKVPLQTAADYARDPSSYNPEHSWRRALKENDVPEVLAAECARSWISDPPPAWMIQGSVSSAINPDRPAEMLRVLKAKQKLISDLQHHHLQMKSTPLIESIRMAAQPPTPANPISPWRGALAREIGETLSEYDLLAPWESPRGDYLAPRHHPPLGASPAVVGDLIFPRLRLRNWSLGAGTPPPDAVSLTDRLRAFDSAPEKAKAGLTWLAESDGPSVNSSRNEWIRQLAPWFPVLAQSARRALATDDGTEQFVPASLWSWRCRLRFLPLLASRALLESFFDQTEAMWGRQPEPRTMGWLGVWLWAEHLVKPSAFPSVLHRQLTLYRVSRLSSGLDETFHYMEDFPTLVFKQAGSHMIVEVLPWLEKIESYGKLGRMSLDFRRRLADGGGISDREKNDWDHLRRRLASANGLELAARLKYALDDFVRWRRLPKDKRPAKFKVEWPADPGQLL